MLNSSSRSRFGMVFGSSQADRDIVKPTVTAHTGKSLEGLPAIGAPPKTVDARVRPGRCSMCGTIPTTCPTDGEYQCRCPLPWLIKLPKESRPKLIPRVHYNRSGRSYGTPGANYPSYAEDAAWVVAGGIPPTW